MSLPIVDVRDVHKVFVLHLQGGKRIDGLSGVNLQVFAGECVALRGPSGVGKSTLLRCIYGNYRFDQGAIQLRNGTDTLDMGSASTHAILAWRRSFMSYASQFLRVIPRVSSVDLVADTMSAQGMDVAEARERARDLLNRLHIGPSLHDLPPATFSGGEQQRVNLARAIAGSHPLLLLDEPSSALDANNRRIVFEELERQRDLGRTLVVILHAAEDVAAIATREYFLSPLEQAHANKRFL